MADKNDSYNQSINNAMVSDSNFLMDIILRECGDVFLGINSLIDVAGGHGGAASAIAKAFPQMKCTVLDLPHVVEEAPTDDHVSFISGDMFKYIPPADALFLKKLRSDHGIRGVLPLTWDMFGNGASHLEHRRQRAALPISCLSTSSWRFF